MMTDLASELDRRKRAAWGFKNIEDIVKRTKNIRLSTHLFNTTILAALTYASETWMFRKQEENAVSVSSRKGDARRFSLYAIERSDSKLTPTSLERTAGRPATRWSDLFTKSSKEKYDAFRVHREKRCLWATPARDQNEWKYYWCPLERIDEQRGHR